MDGDMSALRRCIRLGVVTDVNEPERMVRVAYPDQKTSGGAALASGWLYVLQAPPLVTLQGWEDGAEFAFASTHATFPRTDPVNAGEDYDKAYPDQCEINRTDVYVINSSEDVDELVHENWRFRLTVRPWLPWLGQRVLVLCYPIFNADGFVIGGMPT